MEKKLNIAVVGATGVVGREMVNILEERGFPIGTLTLLASPRSAGEKITFGSQELTVQVTAAERFKDIDIALFSAGSEAAKAFAPIAAEAGAIVIDNSSAWRLDPQVPLVVPEVNASALAELHRKRIIANPNCSTIQLMVALGPLHAIAPVDRIVVSTYQAVSGAGKDAMDELSSQVSHLFNQNDFTPTVFPKTIAFNCLPHIDTFQDDGFTREEHKMLHESRKILEAPALGVCATCVRVPVFNGHAESVVARFAQPITLEQARTTLREAPGVFLQDDPSQNLYPTPLEVNGSDATCIGRLRVDPSEPNSLAFWCVADNLRKGAATNAVQIAELVARDYLK